MANTKPKTSSINHKDKTPGRSQERAVQRHGARQEATRTLSGLEGLERKAAARKILEKGIKEDR